MKTKDYRLTGWLYLAVIICAGLSQGYIRTGVLIPGDPLANAASILKHEELYRLGLSLDLIAFIIDAIISVLLYQMFKSYNKSLAMASSALRLIAHPAIGTLSLLNHYLALEVLGGSDYLGAFSSEHLASLSALFSQAHHYGYLIAGGFFGLHCLLLGILIIKSDNLPRILGLLLMASASGYLTETFGNFNLPGHESFTALLVGVTAAVGELSLSLYLIIRGRLKL